VKILKDDSAKSSVPDNMSPDLSRRVAKFLQRHQLTDEAREDFLNRVLPCENLDDLPEEERATLSDEEPAKKKSIFEETTWTLPVKNEEQLIGYLAAHDIAVKDFLQTPIFRANEEHVSFLKTLWLRKEETPEQPKPVSALPIMVAFYLEPDAAQKIALDCEGKCEPQELHVTLMILGSAENVPDALSAQLKKAIGDYATNAVPVHGIVSGIGCFTNTPTESATLPFYASVDLPGIAEWREQLRTSLPVPIDNTHGFTPHCTLAYIDKDAAFPTMSVPAEALLFENLWLCIGEDRTAFALQGHEQK